MRVIDGVAEAERVAIWLSGPWAEETPAARRQLVRNLAHELAHVRQYTLGEPSESRLFHEGFAEAMALEALADCGSLCGGEPDELSIALERRCGAALARGPLDERMEDDDEAYGCGAILALAASEQTGLPVPQLYEAFVRAGRTAPGFIALCEQQAGPAFAVSAAAFLRGDHRLADPSLVIERLAAGRL